MSKISFPMIYLLSLFTLICCIPMQEENRNQNCSSDQDCPDICSHTSQCTTMDRIKKTRIIWTVNTQSPTPSNPTPCNRISSFKLRFISARSAHEDLVYSPIPCKLGQIVYDKLPDIYQRLQMSAFSEADQLLEEKTRWLDEKYNEVSLDWSP